MLELDIPSVSAIIAAIGVLVGVVLTVLELRNLVRQRQTDLVMRVYSTYGTGEFRDASVETCNLQFKDYEDFERKYGPWFSKGPAQMAVFIVGWYFEGIGALLQKILSTSASSTAFSADQSRSTGKKWNLWY